MLNILTGAAKSNTMQFSAGLIILGLLEQFTNLIPAVVPPQYAGIALAGVGLVTALLRLKTSVPLSDK